MPLTSWYLHLNSDGQPCLPLSDREDDGTKQPIVARVPFDHLGLAPSAIVTVLIETSPRPMFAVGAEPHVG